MAEIIDGRAIARELEGDIAREVEALVAAGGPRPGLAVVLVGDDPASGVYVGQKAKACERVGLAGTTHRLPASVTQDELLALIGELNADRQVHGILCQVPLPKHIDVSAVQRTIAPEKDVDGFHPLNVGLRAAGAGGIGACTPLAIMKLLDSQRADLAGLEALVIGRSNIVGKPVALMLVERGCTVTIGHSRTVDLPAAARRADIIVAAAGVPELVRGDWVKQGALVIDVGISRVRRADGGERLVGDVAFAEVQHARAVTPVPGGVGPMTIACLLGNTLAAARSLAGSVAQAPGRPLQPAR